MFMNDKQSKLVRSSTAQCNDLPKQMQTGDLLQHQQITAQAPALRAHISTALAIEANFNRCNGSPFVKTQRTCHRSHTSPTRYLNKSSTTNNNNNSLFTALPASNSTGQVVGVKCLKKSRHSSRLTPWKRCPKCSSLLHAREPGNFGGGPVGCQNITAKKSESTRRTIFNRDSTLHFIVQISSGNINTSVKARAKTHGRTPVSIELPRGR